MRVALNGGFYKAKSLISGAQRCLNLYPENAAEGSGAPVPVTTYLTPGLVKLADGFETTTQVYTTRLLYTATTGALYEVVGDTLYRVSSSWVRTSLGTIPLGTNPCSMADNGLVAVLVDGTPNGWYITLSSDVMTPIVDEAFYGADHVDYLDTFFLFNRPHTNQLYWSPSEWDGLEPFDPLDIAAKTGTADDIASFIVNHGQIWILGAYKGSEVWALTGAADSTFERQPGVFINHGCAAKFSVQRIDTSVFWLNRDEQGQAIVLMAGTGTYEALRISTHAIENEISQYETIEDATSFTYQQEGHAFYVLTFPTADKTWVYDLATKMWHERAWIDDNGCEHRIRPNAAAFAYGFNVVGDWEDGRLFKYDLGVFTDDGDPISRRRGFPQILDDGDRVRHLNLILDMQPANPPGLLDVDEPQVNLRYSDTRGASWGNPVRTGIGSTGQHYRQPQFNQLGMARYRVYEVFWSGDFNTALNGGFLQTAPCAT